MAITYVGGVTFVSANPSNNNVVSFSSLSPMKGDIAIVSQGIGTTSTDKIVSIDTIGYIKIDELYSADSTSVNFAMFYKVLGAGENSVDLGNNSSSPSFAIGCLVQLFRGVDVNNPLDVAHVSAIGNNTGRPSYPTGITPITSGSYIIATGASSYASVDPIPPTNGSSLPTTPTYSTTMLFCKLDSNADITVASVYKQRTSGSELPSGWTGLSTFTSLSRASMLIALRPATEFVTGSSFLLFM